MPLNLQLLAGTEVVQAGTSTPGDTTLAGLDTVALAGAVKVAGPGLAPGTVVSAITDDTSVVLSRAATVSGTGSYTFTIMPVGVSDTKKHCRIDIPDDDEYVGRLIGSATRFLENDEGRGLITKTWMMVQDAFPFGGGYYNRMLRQFYGAFPGAAGATFPGFLPTNTGIITLPRAPILSVEAVEYRSPSGAWMTMDPANYEVVTGSPGRLSPAYGQIWPVTQPQVGSVKVTFTAGYGPTPDTIPENVQEALGLIIGHWYENRENVAAGTSFATLPYGYLQVLGGEEWGSYQ